MRVARNWLVQRIVDYSFKLAYFLFRVLKPYLRTDYLRGLKEFIAMIDNEMSKELVLRK